MTYRVQDMNNRRQRLVVHFNRLKPYNATQQSSTAARTESTESPAQTREVQHFRWGGGGAQNQRSLSYVE